MARIAPAAAGVLLCCLAGASSVSPPARPFEIRLEAGMAVRRR